MCLCRLSLSRGRKRLDDVAHIVGDEVVILSTCSWKKEGKKKTLKSHGSPIHVAFLGVFVIPCVC